MKKISEATKAKIKTTVFWSALASGFLIFLQSAAILFGYEIPEVLVGQIMTAINSFLALLTLSGVLVDPKKVESYQALSAKARKTTRPLRVMMYKK